MKKRIFSILIALALCLTLLPTTAWAIDYSYPSTTDAAIGSTILTSGTYYLIDNTNGTLSTESASADSYNIYYNTDETGAHSLTLNNANLKSPIYVLGGTTVTLVGENALGAQNNTVSVGIQTISAATGNTALTIKGDGSLTIWCGNEGIADVSSEKDILIEGGTIRITNTQSSPIYSRNGSITISGNANVTANSGNSPVQCKKDLTITGNAVVNATNGAGALESSSGKIIISENAQVSAKSTNKCPIYGNYGLEILGNASVTAEGKEGGLSSFYGYILIEGKVTATATQAGYAAVSAGTDYPGNTTYVTVKGELTAKGGVGIGVAGAGDITIDGGTVTADAKLAGIYPMGGGNVEIKNNANVTAGVTSATGIPTGSGIHVKGGSISISNSTVESSTESSSFNALGATPTLTYSDSYKVYAGTSKEEAALIPHADLTAETYQNKYVKIEPVPSYSITVTGGSAQVEKAPEGATVTITADVPEGQRFVKWTSSNNNVTFADETAEKTTFTMPDSDVTVTAITTSTAQDAPAAPQLASSTTSSITLKEITASENGAAAEYGISTDGGETWTWQDSPEFTGLTSGTEYTFAVRYGATTNGNYVASPASETAKFSTDKPNVVDPVVPVVPPVVVTPTYPPAVEDADNGTVSVTPANPRQGSTVTVTPTPDKGYEVDSITVTDSKGNPVAVTDNGDGTYSFTQPVGKVTISVTYVCDGLTDNCPSYHLADVDTSAWYHLAVDFVMEKGLMNGYGDGSFGPNDTLTRAELAQILYNKEERPSVSGSAFTDVADGAWYADAVTWVNQNGIVGGYGNGRFGPGDPITREQLAVMLWRYAGCPAATQKELRFTDADQVSSWAWEAMLWATENGVMNGYSGILNPRGTATRAEAAQMLKNFIENT